MSKIISLKEAVKKIHDGNTVAIGGSLLRRHPMAIVREIIRQGKKNLHLLGWNNAIDFDLLIGAGCATVVETAYVGMGIFGMAKNFRRLVESGHVKMIDQSETTATDRFRAGSIGLTFFPSKTPIGTDLGKVDPHYTEIQCPFTGEKYAALKAWNPDVAIIHAHSADIYGNIKFDEKRMMDNEIDIIIAKSAKTVIVSVEEIVDTKFITKNPNLTLLPTFFVDAVVLAPYGAHPCSCDCRYNHDDQHIIEYQAAAQELESFQQYLQKYVYGTLDDMDYLEKIGIRRLIDLNCPRGGVE